MNEESMDAGYLKSLVILTSRRWLDDKAQTESAALAFYFVLSLPALLLFSVSIGSVFLRSKDLQSIILNYLGGVLDQRVLEMLNLLFERIPEISSLSTGAFLGFVLLLWSASNYFRQLKSFLEKIWDVKPVINSRVKGYIRDAFLSFVMVIIFGGLLVISIIIEGILFSGSRFIQEILPFSPGIIALYASSIASFLILVLFFMFIYRVLPDTNLDFKTVFVGSLVTVSLITLGKYVVGFYLAHSGLATVYGVIGSIIGLFLWIYYSSIIITIGAEFTKVYSES